MNGYLLKLLFFLILCGSAFGQTGSISGKVTFGVDRTVLHQVAVRVAQLDRTTVTDDAGIYRFDGLPAGRYTITTHIEGFTDQAQTVDLSTGGSATLDFALSLTGLREDVTVTATGTEESVYESFQSVNSVGSTRIREQASTGIGEVLEREAGVGKRSFGPGTSRPVIRGFDGDRVLVLQDGVRTGSVGSQSGDHGEPIDTLSLERLEVIKGPATLLYGSNAIGGVVNAVSSDENDPHEGLRASFTALGGTNSRQAGVSGGVEYGYKKFRFNVNGNYLREGDMSTPLGRIPNSASRNFGGKGSIGYFGGKFYWVGSVNFDRRRYGVPYAPLFESGELLTDSNGDPCQNAESGKGGDCEYDPFAIRDRFSTSLPEIPDEQIDLKMRSNNYRLRGGFQNLKGPITHGSFSLDFTDYQHQEIETANGIDEVATTFYNDTFSYRALFQQADRKKLSGRFGFDGFRRSYLTEGAEALVVGRVRQNNFAAYALEEFSFDRVALQFGGRIESNRYDPVDAIYTDLSFTGVSAAASARFRLWNGASFVASFNSSYRAPALEEPYNNGAHIGTVTFEIGDQTLGRERSNGIEFSLRQQTSRFRINGSVFYYNIDDFIFLAPVDADGNGRIDVEDNLPIGAYEQAGARFVGADLSVDVDINKYFGAFFNGDIVKAKLREADLPLPRITPAKARLGLDLRYKGLSVRPEAVFVSDKKADDVFTLETPTAGYGLFNLNASYTVSSDHVSHILTVSGTNLGDRLYRNHLSFIKNLAPEPGRGVRFSYTLRLY